MTGREHRYLWLALCTPVLALAVLGACDTSPPRMPGATQPVEWLDGTCTGPPRVRMKCESLLWREAQKKKYKAVR